MVEVYGSLLRTVGQSVHRHQINKGKPNLNLNQPSSPTEAN
jgi:hypothetical protein